VNRTIILLFISCSLYGQSNRYFVSFKDKANTIYSVSNPRQFLSQKSIDRRARENFITTEEDFPVNASYVQQVKATGAEVYFTSRWFNGVLVQTDPATISTIGQLSFVSAVEMVAPGTKLVGGRVRAQKKLEQINSVSGFENDWQLKMIGIDKMKSEGYNGEGVDIAVFDAGFIGVNKLTAFQLLNLDGRLKAAFNFVNNNADVYTADNHGTAVLSIMAATISGIYQGGVYKANYFLYQTEDVASEYRIEEYNWLFAAEHADSAGVQVINSSLGYNQFDDSSMDYTYQDFNGKTSVVARAARKAFERGINVVNSVGNEGDNSWKYLLTPADADGVLATGAVDNTGTRTSFSSIGPSSDGRIKPDVAAMGYLTEVVISDTPLVGNGTSFSSPLIACLAAGLRQVFPKASADEIYSRIINSGSQALSPDNNLGYGIPNFEIAKGDFEVYPNPVTDHLKMVFSYPNNQTITLSIFDYTGKEIAAFTDTVKENPYSFDMLPFATGMYYLTIRTSVGSKSVRILKLD
jgi:serine protease AprX